MVKAYPDGGNDEEQTLLDAARSAGQRVSNPNNLVVATDGADKYRMQQDATENIWTWHPK